MRKILFACAVLVSMPAVRNRWFACIPVTTTSDGPSATVLAAQLDQNGPPEAMASAMPARPAGTCNGNSGTSSREPCAP